MRKGLVFILAVAATAVILAFGGRVGLPLDRRQVESLTIFAGLIGGILLYEDKRLAISLAGVAGLLGMGLMSVRQFVESAELDVILFLLGTFLVAGYLEQTSFFEHLVSQIVRNVGPRPGVLLCVLMGAAMITSGIIGEVAAILFVGGAMLHICNRCKLNPGPFLMMLVFATNTGSAATAFGPVAVTIALKAHLSVMAFFRWTTPIAVVVLAMVVVICRCYFPVEWQELALAMRRDPQVLHVADVSRAGQTRAGWMLLLGMGGLLVFHAQIENYFGLSPNVLLLATPLGAGSGALFLAGSGAKELLEQRVDWATLAFFLMLFAAVGALEATGVMGVVAQSLVHVSGGRPAVLVLIVGWLTGIVSGLLANMLAVASFLPVVAELNARGAHCPTAIYWLMLCGGTFMGNLTPIGSTCNIIACGMVEKRGHEPIGFVPWVKIGLIVSLASMGLATLLLAVQTGWLSRG